jgi:uroporphyrin-III C-methyltransferase/precorrin-2 dehydrogenase/sirohydrochlorin ferrochelatase
MKLYPLFANLADRSVLVVGGGEVAARKCEALLGSGAHVRVGAPALNERLSEWVGLGRITHLQGHYRSSWLDETWLVIAATDDITVNRRVADDATARRILINVVDNAALSSFHVPAVIDRAPVQVAISSGGNAPMLARWIRERLELFLDHAIGPLATLLERSRGAIRFRYRDLAARRRFYDRVLGGSIWQMLRAGKVAAAETELRRSLRRPEQRQSGHVALVGAGPGDPGLLTLRALRVINEADVILHDRLVSAEVLDLARRDAQRIEVGKEAGNHHATQEQIHALLRQHAQAGRRVVRLKGGDPFVFGRGGEELEFLRSHDIAYEVVPGVTAALACAAYSGVPLTHREHAHSVQFVTAHCRESLDALDWKALAAPRQTLAVYMGVAHLGALRERLLAAGRAPDTPVAAIENGTRSDQRVIISSIERLADLAQTHALRSPSLLIIGEVAAFGQTLAWFGNAPVTAQDLAATMLQPTAVRRRRTA